MIRWSNEEPGVATAGRRGRSEGGLGRSASIGFEGPGAVVCSPAVLIAAVFFVAVPFAAWFSVGCDSPRSGLEPPKAGEVPRVDAPRVEAPAADAPKVDTPAGSDRQPRAASEPPSPDQQEVAPNVRRFEFRYAVELDPQPVPTDLFVPVAQSDVHQTVHDLAIDSNIAGKFGTEPVYSNRYWHAHVPANQSLKASFRYQTTRRPIEPALAVGKDGQVRTGSQPADDLKPFLGANRLVPVEADVLEPILKEVRASAKSRQQADLARAIYDWVVDNIEYKKVGQGWGNGDTHWACSERYGNCTDFHSLFISLARSLGIPARFEIGFPVGDSDKQISVKGYHCWLQFYLPSQGWVPVDASEAKKAGGKTRDRFFGSQPTDRIHFTTGRDLRLGPKHRAAALNYFVYPHAEQAGAVLTEGVRTQFAYRSL